MLGKLKRRVTIRFEAGRRRLGRGNVWHEGANRQRRQQLLPFRRDWRYLRHSALFAPSMARPCRIFVV